MVFHHIKRIRNPHHRRAVYGLLSLHGIFLSLVAIKTAIMHIAGLKAIVYGSSVLMGLMGMLDIVPHVTFAQSPASIDYSISNSTYPVMTDQGQMVVYMYYFQNDSNPYTVGSDVVVSANIPAGMIYHSHEGPAYSSISSSQITWHIPNNSNRFGMILLRLMVSPGASGPLTNTVTLTAANPDPVMSNNSATAVVIANSSNPASMSNIDLAITKTVNKTQATLMDDIIFTIHYVNNGSQTASGVKLYEILPPELYIVYTSQPPSTVTNNLYTWNLGSLAPGQGGTITLRTSILPIVPNNHTIINYAVISSQMVEANIANNSAEVSILVQDEQPNMYIDIIAPKTTICVDETLRFVVNFGNQGLGTADAITVRHDKPSTLAYVASSKTANNVSPGVYVRDYYSASFFPSANASFTMDLKGLSPGVDQTIPVKIFDNGVQLAQSTFYVTVVPASLCNTITEPETIPGCTNPSATNYNPDANESDNSCQYTANTGDNQTIPGCTNPSANNYNPNATQNNRTCQFDPPITGTNPIYGCMISTATNYNPNATHSNNSSCLFAPTNTGSNNTGSTNTGFTFTGGNNTGFVSTGPVITLPKTVTGVVKDTKPVVTPVFEAKPSKTNFFIARPAPIKAEPRTQTVSTIQSLSATPPTTPKIVYTTADIPTECEDTMVDIYTYASDAGLISNSDIPTLCQPITRVKLAELMVNFSLKLALVEPNLRRRCVFDDLDNVSNEAKFYAALACDFGFLGVDEDGVVNKNFRPHDEVTRAEFAVVLARFLFGDTYNKMAVQGDTWYSTAMRALNEAYVMRNINNPSDSVLLGHGLSMLRRIDLASLLQNSKYIKLRQN